MSQHTAGTFLGLLIGKLRRWPSLLWRWEARLKGVEFQGASEFLGRPRISLAKGSRIVLGDGVTIYSSVRANPLSLPQPSALRALAPGAQIILGPRVGLSGTALCAAARIEIGEGTILGACSMVLDHDVPEPAEAWDRAEVGGSDARPVKIGRGAFIGTRALVLKGVTIGDRAVVGAGAVVTTDVPAYHLAVGNPIRVLPPKPLPANCP
jgi:acetyltransferase-like isoleucine patch superfamily enzyme